MATLAIASYIWTGNQFWQLSSLRNYDFCAGENMNWGRFEKFTLCFCFTCYWQYWNHKTDIFFSKKCTCTINCLFNIEAHLFCLINQNSSCIVQCTFQLYKFIFVCIVLLLTISNKEDGVSIFTNFFLWAFVRAVKSLASKPNELGKVLLPIQPDWEKKSSRPNFLTEVLLQKRFLRNRVILKEFCSRVVCQSFPLVFWKQATLLIIFFHLKIIYITLINSFGNFTLNSFIKILTLASLVQNCLAYFRWVKLLQKKDPMPGGDQAKRVQCLVFGHFLGRAGARYLDRQRCRRKLIWPYV